MTVRTRRISSTDGKTVPFEGFVAAAGDGLLRLATVVTADRSTAQDVVQAVLERAFRDWERISALEFRDTYVRRMVVNEALTLRRRARRIVLTDHVPEPRSAPPDPSGRIGQTQELSEAVRRLPPKQRAAIALRYFCDLSDRQVAERMGCREVTVRGYVLRALRTLRVDLDPGAAEPGDGVRARRAGRAATTNPPREQR
jgi:RNA polymerase sigma-70 factor (sigma-E family)